MEPDPISDSAAPGGSHLALYRRWRAQTFGRIVGQDAVVTTLRNAVRIDQVAHALLFVGPRGTGKTSMARIVAKALNCTDLRDGDACDVCPSCVAIREGRTLDVVELDAATNNRVAEMRELLERTWTAPSDMRRKVFIIDEVQRITDGWDVLLKTLEEPPPDVVFIFCTTEPAKIRPAVLSRVQRFEFRPLTVPQIEGKLTTILDAEGRGADPEAIALVARQAAGGMRDAESMLDQLLTSGTGVLTADGVRDLLGLVEAEVVDSFLAAMADPDPLAGIGILDDLEAAGRDLGAFLDQVVSALRSALTAALGTSTQAEPRWSVAALTEAARRLVTVDPSRPGSGGIRFQLELALIGAATSTSGAANVVRSTPRADSPVRTVGIVPDREATTTPVVPSGPASNESGARTRAPARGGTPEPSSDPERTDPVADEPVATMGSRRPGSADRTIAAPADPGAMITPVGDPGAATGPGVTPGSGLADDDLRTLDRLWPSIVAELSKSPAIKALIEDCRPIAADGNAVTLGFPEGKAFLKDVAERRRATLEAAIARALGHPVVVRLVATNLDLLPPPSPVDRDADGIVEAARRIFADDLVDAGEVG